MASKCSTCDAPAIVYLGVPSTGRKVGENYCRDCAIYMVEALAAHGPDPEER